MSSGPLDPSGKMRGCFVGRTIVIWDIAPFRVAAAFIVHTVFKKKKRYFLAGAFWVQRDFVSCKYRSTTVGTFRTTLTRRQFVSHVISRDENMIS